VVSLQALYNHEFRLPAAKSLVRRHPLQLDFLGDLKRTTPTAPGAQPTKGQRVTLMGWVTAAAISATHLHRPARRTRITQIVFDKEASRRCMKKLLRCVGVCDCDRGRVKEARSQHHHKKIRPARSKSRWFK